MSFFCFSSSVTVTPPPSTTSVLPYTKGVEQLLEMSFDAFRAPSSVTRTTNHLCYTFMVDLEPI